MARLGPVFVLAALLMFSGCDDPSGLAAGGLIVEPQAAEVQPAERNEAPEQGLRGAANDVARDDDPDHQARDGWDRDRQLPSDTEDWGNDREMPSDRMPSQRQVTGRDREMPSDTAFRRSSPAESDREPADNSTREPSEE